MRAGRHILGGASAALLVAGVGIVLLHPPTTAAKEAHAQAQLREELERPVPVAPVSPTSRPHEPRPRPPRLGHALARLVVPRIGLDAVVVQGVRTEDLMKGPGHYVGTPLPCAPGNVAIAGHRTTYGAPFNRIDELKRGDRIKLTSRWGACAYAVRSTRAVLPSDVSVLDPAQGSVLTLTTCTPEGSATHRLVVRASLVARPS